VKIAYVLRCPRLREISTQDIAIPNDGKQYRIENVQYPEDIYPPVMDLTLEELTAVYFICQPEETRAAKMNLNIIENALLTVGVPVCHYTASKQTDKYIVWAEDGQAASTYADDEMQEQAIQGTVDYYTRTKDDTNITKIQKALNGVCSWRLNSIQYEDDTPSIIMSGSMR
jgi:hypothetical protein